MSRDAPVGVPLVGAQAANDIMTKTDERDGNVGKERKKGRKICFSYDLVVGRREFFLQ